MYGQENGWALIGYGLSNGGYRIGFVAMSAIPQDVIPQALQLTYVDKNNVSDSLFVDDPIVSTNRELLKRYGLYGPPGMLFFNPARGDNAVHKVIGFQDAVAFQTSLDRALTP